MIDRIKRFIKDTEMCLTFINNKIHITNYEEILSIDNNRISFQTSTGIIIIKGDNITLNKMLDKEVLINGNISSIEVHNE